MKHTLALSRYLVATVAVVSLADPHWLWGADAACTPGTAAAPKTAAAMAPTVPIPGGDIPGPFPIFPATNWWNADISLAPVDSNSANFITFINNGSPQALHPDCGGEVSPGSVEIYGMPYLTVDGTQPKLTVNFVWPGESDGVGLPFYPIPAETITQPHWIEGGEPGNIDLRCCADRHMLIVDRDNKYLYELYNVFYDGAMWQAGSGAFWDMNTNNRRPEGWTSADASGMAILPGLLRWEEVYGAAEIGHAHRVTLRDSNGYVYPGSHVAGSNPLALPMGARLRLKASVDISGFDADMQRIFRAFKKYGLIMADNGSDMYVTGTFDTRWDNGILNPAFGALTASDFDVIQLGWIPACPTVTTHGDLNQDGFKNAGDAVILSNYLVGNLTQGAPPFSAPLSDADLNQDTFVNSVDAVILANFLVGNVLCLPI